MLWMDWTRTVHLYSRAENPDVRSASSRQGLLDSISLWRVLYQLCYLPCSLQGIFHYLELLQCVPSSQVESLAITVVVYCSRFKVWYPRGNPTFQAAHDTCTIVTLSSRLLKGQIELDKDIFDCSSKHGSINGGNMIEVMNLKLLGVPMENQGDLSCQLSCLPSLSERESPDQRRWQWIRW